MTETEKTKSKRALLLESNNFAAWKQGFLIYARIKKWYVSDTWEPNRLDEAIEYILTGATTDTQQIVFNAIENNIESQDINEILKDIGRSFGYGLKDPYHLWESIRNQITFPILLEPSHVITWFQLRYADYRTSGGKEKEIREIVDVFRAAMESNSFWAPCRQRLYQMSLEPSTTMKQCDETIFCHWEGTLSSDQRQRLKTGPFSPYRTEKEERKALRTSAPKFDPSKHCRTCYDSKKSAWLHHTTENHLPFDEWLRQKKNKPISNYCGAIYWDTGASKTYTPQKPNNFKQL